eukprot:5996338-Amphidinium_carterae.2
MAFEMRLAFDSYRLLFGKWLYQFFTVLFFQTDLEEFVLGLQRHLEQIRIWPCMILAALHDCSVTLQQI